MTLHTHFPFSLGLSSPGDMLVFGLWEKTFQLLTIIAVYYWSLVMQRVYCSKGYIRILRLSSWENRKKEKE